MAWALYRQGKFNDALEYIEKAIVIDSPLPDAVLLDHAGDINAAAGNKKKAVELWKKALTTYNEDLDRGATRKKIAEIEPETAECAREK
jgi:tetratricopeptide (TPR) repeat protein